MPPFRSWCPLAAVVAAVWLLGDGTAQAKDATPKCPVGAAFTTPNSWSAARSQLLPPGVQSLLLCSYKTKLVTKTVVLTSRVLSNGRPLRTLVGALRALPADAPSPNPPGAMPGSATSCPKAFEPKVAIFARYRHRPPLELLLDEARCEMVSNGHVSRYFTTDRAFATELNRLISAGRSRTLQATAAMAQAKPAAAKCPAVLNSKTVVNSWSATQTSLIPGGVQSLLMCWYKPPALPKPGPLAHRVLVPRGKTLTTLVDGMRSLSGTLTGPINCPADFGANVLLLATYGQHAPVKLLLDTTGCASVTNGPLTGYFDGGGAPASALASDLARLLPWSELPAPGAAPAPTASTP